MNTPVENDVLNEARAEAVQHVLVVSVHTQHYALPLEVVDRVTWAVAITAVPDYPDEVLGVVNVQGNVLPVISLRRVGDTDAECENASAWTNLERRRPSVGRIALRCCSASITREACILPAALERRLW